MKLALKFAAVALLVTAVLPLLKNLAAAKPQRASPIVVYASQTGRPTLDQGEGGGNPFASALQELLDRPSLSLAQLLSDLVTVTKDKSRGFQIPDISGTGDIVSWTVKPVTAPERRIALVIVYSDYADAHFASLPGAKLDLKRVSKALNGAGFKVRSTENPSRLDLHAALEELANSSSEATAAAIYLTGHGVENGRRVYLLPSDFSSGQDPERLSELAVDVSSLTKYLKARSANIVFFGGCRTYYGWGPT